MCFSASSSFTSSALLSLIAFAVTTQVKSKNQYPLAALPFIFASMQFVEGMVWSAYDYGFYPSVLIPFAGYFFFFVIYYVWPWILPLAFLMPETQPIRRKVLRYIFILSLVVQGIIFILTIKNFHHPDVQIVNHSIQYAFDIMPNSISVVILAFGLLLYGIPALISSLRGTSILVLITVPAFIFSYITYYATFASVWCFFCAIASSAIFIVLYLNKSRVVK